MSDKTPKKRIIPTVERKSRVKEAMSIHNLYNGNAIANFINASLNPNTTCMVSHTVVQSDIHEIFEQNRRLYSDMALGGAQHQITTMLNDTCKDIADLRTDIRALKIADDYKPSESIVNVLNVMEKANMTDEVKIIERALKHLNVRANIGKRAFAYDQLIKMRTFYHDLLMAHPLYDLAETDIGKYIKNKEPISSQT